MSIDHKALRDAVGAEEQSLRDFNLSDANLFRLASELLAASPAPLSARVVLGRRTVAELASAGTGGDNAVFLTRKINVVFNTAHSSLWWHHHLRMTGRQLKDVHWADPREVVDLGGSFPLFAGEAVVGAVAVSGLAHDEDHDLIVRVMRALA